MSEDLWLDLEPGKSGDDTASASVPRRRWALIGAAVVVAVAIIAAIAYALRPDPVPAASEPAESRQPVAATEAGADAPDVDVLEGPPESAAAAAPLPATAAAANPTPAVAAANSASPDATAPANDSATVAPPAAPHKSASAPRPNKEMVWSQTFRPGPACLNPEDWDAYVDCVNKSLRARQEFEERWARGELPKP